MKSAHFQRFQVKVEPLSPIHVGGGETVEPYEYDLVERPEGQFLFVFDLPAILSQLTDRQRAEFNTVERRQDLLALRNWFRRNSDPEHHLRFRILVKPEAFREIRQHLNDPARCGEIHLFTRHIATGQPYLPGSSLKGAIRTALVDELLGQKRADETTLLEIARHAHSDRKAGALFEATTMGNLAARRPGDSGRPDLYRDPFKQLGITDLAAPESPTNVDRVRIVNQNGQPMADASGILMYREVTLSVLDDTELEFTGEMRLNPSLTDPRIMGNDDHGVRNAVPFAIGHAGLCRNCNDFYRPRLEAEIRNFTVDPTVAKKLLAAVENMKANQCLVRIGRHSHFECVTVRAPFHQPPSRGFGRSRSYVAGRLPLGWARMSIEPMALSP